MEMNLADAKARFSEVVDRAAGGESIDILRRGKLVARVVPVEKPKVKVDVERLKALTDSMPMAKTRAVDLIREMRDDARY